MLKKNKAFTLGEALFAVVHCSIHNTYCNAGFLWTRNHIKS